MAETRLAFKAGRAFRRGNTNFVDPDPTKGAILLQNGPDDGLLHFVWKDRTSGAVEEVRFSSLRNGVCRLIQAGFDTVSGRRELCEGARERGRAHVRPQVLVLGPKALCASSPPLREPAC